MTLNIDRAALVKEILEKWPEIQNKLKLIGSTKFTTDPTNWTSEWDILYSVMYPVSTDYYRNKVYYIRLIEPNYEYGDNFIRRAEKMCIADELEKQLEECPTTVLQRDLLRLFKEEREWNNQLLRSSNNEGIDKLLWVPRELILRSQEINNIQYTLSRIEKREQEFRQRIKTASSRFVDVCIALVPLNLGTYPLIFITNFLSEFNLLAEIQKVRIIESIDKKLKCELSETSINLTFIKHTK